MFYLILSCSEGWLVVFLSSNEFLVLLLVKFMWSIRGEHILPLTIYISLLLRRFISGDCGKVHW